MNVTARGNATDMLFVKKLEVISCVNVFTVFKAMALTVKISTSALLTNMCVRLTLAALTPSAVTLANAIVDTFKIGGPVHDIKLHLVLSVRNIHQRS